MSGAVRRPAERLARTLARLLPADTLSAAVAIDGEPLLAHPTELEVVARAVDKRRREFTTGRALAHELLARLGAPDVPLLPGTRRAPTWPDGVVGSISHGAALCVAAVARTRDCAALGLDIEGAEPLKRKLWRHILRDEEQAALEPLSDELAGRRAKLVFSAKECFYKALSPQLDRVLAFEDVRLTLADDGRFTGELLVDDAGLVLEAPLVGRWSSDDDWVLTALVLPPAR